MYIYGSHKEINLVKLPEQLIRMNVLNPHSSYLQAAAAAYWASFMGPIQTLVFGAAASANVGELRMHFVISAMLCELERMEKPETLRWLNFLEDQLLKRFYSDYFEYL